jgi:diguanylate cyclase (GGDEF)-like protein/PAS domain S-box-containing protein
LLDAALASVDNAVLITDAHGSALWVNRALSKLSGYSSEDILGKTPKMFSSGHQDADFFQRFWQTIGSGRTWHGEIVNARPDGSTYTVNQTVTPLLEASGQVSHFVAILEDITQRKAAEARVQHNAQFDLLTDLPNRGLFLDRLAQALNLGERNGESAALLFLDLDHFKEVNDQLGHAAGDDLLIAVGVRLREQVRQSDTVARLGGDEFTVILPNLRDREDAVRVANGIIAAIGKPFDIAGTQVKVGITIGIALFPAHGDTVEQVLKAADDAMYQAKESGRNRYAFAAAPAEALTING